MFKTIYMVIIPRFKALKTWASAMIRAQLADFYQRRYEDNFVLREANYGAGGTGVVNPG